MQKRWHQQKLIVIDLKGATGFGDTTLPYNQALSPFRQRPTDNRPFLECNSHTLILTE
jgi:hypothetical protein